MEEEIRIYIKKIPDRSEVDRAEVRSFPASRRDNILRLLEKADAGKTACGRTAAEAYAAGILLRDVLNIRKNEDLRIPENEKPYMADGSCFFSLSHSTSFAVLAVSPVEIGADTEPVRPLTDSLMRKVFTEEERQFAQKDPEKKPVLLWTRLEALLKLSGEGISGIDKRTKSLLSSGEQIYFNSFEYEDSFISTSCERDLPVRFMTDNKPISINLF